MPLPWKRYHVDQQDLQGNLLAGYGNCYPQARYYFMVFEGAASGREWLSALADKVTTAVPWMPETRPAYTVNVSLSRSGLRALGLPEPLLATFPKDFLQGMSKRAGPYLRDKGPSAPEYWEKHWDETTHVMLTLMARDPDAMERGVQDALAGATASGVVEVDRQDAGLLGNPDEGQAGREHFGFADGFAQPTIRGNAGPYSRKGGGTPKRWRRWKDVAPGEFVLGYPAEDKTYATKPVKPLRKNGTYTVVRKLEQKVDRFNEYLRWASGGNEAREEWLAAGIVGRWRDGTPLMLSSNSPNPEIAADRGPKGGSNNFRFGSDLRGEVCPLGSHIRRANPRDALGWQGKLTKRHRIIRRGMPYGPEPKTNECGLMFVCHQASISKQFEVIQGQWLNDGDAFWLGDERDFLTNGRPGERMTLQGRPPIFLDGKEPNGKHEPAHPPFVITKGGGYFFTPGILALRRIAAGAWQ